jgi:hypothetical protein
MKKCTQQEFERQLKKLQEDKQSGLSGPFIHAAPRGNMFRGPFREQAWLIGKTTILKKVWAPATGWQFYRSDDGDIE